MNHQSDIRELVFPYPGVLASLFFGAAIYTLFKALLPTDNYMLLVLRRSAEIWALLPLILLIFFSLIKAYRRRLGKLNLQSLRDMHYSDFRLLVAESLRREGFFVAELSGFDADHGNDLVLHKDGHRIAVFCRHWESEIIDLFQVKELYETMHKNGANAALYITTGQFTPEAHNLAKSSPIVLADGNYLLDLVNPLRVHESYQTARYLRRASLEPIY